MNGRMPAAGEPLPTESERPHGSGIVAYLLMFMGLSTLAACVLLPEWRAYQAMHRAEQVEWNRAESMRRVVERERRLLEATRDDPGVIARLAQRELGFRRPGELSVLVSVPQKSVAHETAFTPDPVPLPRSLARLAGYLPDYNYDAVFCDNQTRAIIMAMSVALTCLALCLPGSSAPGWKGSACDERG